MILKRCRRCGKEYAAGKEWSYLCEDCGKIAKRETVYKTRICTVCGASYTGAPAAKYCPSCQVAVRREQRRIYNHVATKRQARPLGSTDICKNCGKEYIVNGSRQMYCSICGPQVGKLKELKRKREYAAENYDALKRHMRDMKVGSKLCVVCGNPITSRSNTVTCSAECKAENRSQTLAKADFKRGKRITPPKDTRRKREPPGED